MKCASSVFSTTGSRIQSLKKMNLHHLFSSPFKGAQLFHCFSLQKVGVSLANQLSCCRISEMVVEDQLEIEILFGTCIPVTTAQ